MKEPVTYECRKCGNRFIVTERGETNLVPIYCCGEGVKKIRKKKPSAKKYVRKKKFSKNA